MRAHDDLIEALERDAETYRRRWQRVLAAYLALRELRELPEDLQVLVKDARRRKHRPVTAALARVIEAEKDLLPNDLKVMA